MESPEKSSEMQDTTEGDLTSFFQGLGQWPLYPTAASSETKPSKSSEQSKGEETKQANTGGNGGLNSLSNLIKLEVILDLADGLKMNETEQYFSTIISAADQMLKVTGVKDMIPSVAENEINFSNVTTVEELLEREKLLGDLQDVASPFEGYNDKESIARLSVTQSSAITSESTSKKSVGQAAEEMLKVATSRIEYLVNEASKGLSPNIVNDLVFRSTQVFSNNGTNSVEQLTSDIVSVAEKIARARGLDVQFAAERARDATKGASAIVDIANRLFASGYAHGSRSGVSASELSPDTATEATDDLRPLFADFSTAEGIEPFQYQNVVAAGAMMGILAGAVYEDSSDPLEPFHRVRHSLVANGTTADVAWVVTDSIEFASTFADSGTMSATSIKDDPIFVRTVTLRGFDASDSNVDRERLLNKICTASGTHINAEFPNILFHSGLLKIASEIYKDIKKYIKWASPNHKLIFNGHSIGGSLSVLLLLLMTADKGSEYVKDRVLRVFAFGSPPIAAIENAQIVKQRAKKKTTMSQRHSCQVLEEFGLPANMVFGYVQPYVSRYSTDNIDSTSFCSHPEILQDPIVRFFTEYDALYPLVDDLGRDQVTLYATGPPRSLRPVARALFQGWEGWPEFRDNWKGTNQRYHSVGVQHILAPDPLRYLNDRFFSTNIGVPPTEAIVRISSTELLPALNALFPLDVFQISLVPQAVRSLLHHFYQAYDTPIANYAVKVDRRKKDKEKIDRRKKDKEKGDRRKEDR
eukprot:scaffold22560_cov135-Cylindrotheca_fusiformis.AAC.46